MTVVGFPHSDIHGSILACSSPWLFAAYRVLHRLLAPRHPPYALSSLTFQLLRTKTFLVLCFYSLTLSCFFRNFRGARRSHQSSGLFYSSVKFSRYNLSGGDERNRTADPLLARQVLSQLSYAPTSLCNYSFGGPKWT